MSSFTSQNLTEKEAVAGCTFACICHTVFRMFSCLQINWQPCCLRQLLKFNPFDWLIEIYLQTEGQGTHHKMVSLQPMPGFSPLLPISKLVKAQTVERTEKTQLKYKAKNLINSKYFGLNKIQRSSSVPQCATIYIYIYIYVEISES